MFYNAKNRNIKIDDTDMDYVTFGRGDKPLIMIPGLGDALKTVKGAALALAWMYKAFAKDYQVYVFSRRNGLPEGFSTDDMAVDLANVMKSLRLSGAYVIGISQGGMIAQCLAVKYPALVKKLVLTVTLCRPNATSTRVLSQWIQFAKADDFKSLLIDTAEKTYTEKRLKSYRPFYPLLCKLSRPKSLDRFMVQADACLHHDCYEEIPKINCQTLVIGGDCDQIVGAHSAQEIAARIKGSKLKLYHGLGHGTYEEAKDFNQLVLAFLNES